MSDAMSSSDIRRNCAPEASTIEALRPTISLLLPMVSMRTSPTECCLFRKA